MYSVNLLLSSWTLRTRETICRVLRSWLHLSYLLLCSWRFFFNQFCPMLVSCQSEEAGYASMRHNAFRWAWWRRWGDCSNFSLPFSLISISLDRSYQCFLLPIEKALSSWFLVEQEGSKQEGAKNLHVATIIGASNLKSSGKNIFCAASEYINCFASIVLFLSLLKDSSSKLFVIVCIHELYLKCY